MRYKNKVHATSGITSALNDLHLCSNIYKQFHSRDVAICALRVKGAVAGLAFSSPRLADETAPALLVEGAAMNETCFDAIVDEGQDFLGDTVAVVEKHYARFVTALRERARQIMLSGAGLEEAQLGHNRRAFPSK